MLRRSFCEECVTECVWPAGNSLLSSIAVHAPPQLDCAQLRSTDSCELLCSKSKHCVITTIPYRHCVTHYGLKRLATFSVKLAEL